MDELFVLVERDGSALPWSCRRTASDAIATAATKPGDMMVAGITVRKCRIVLDTLTDAGVNTGGGGGGIEQAVQE